MLDDTLLEAYINSFYGYGNSTAKYWFVGMEEGGGNSLEEIETRLNLWDKRGRNELEDLFEYHQALGVLKYFGEKPKTQSTWKYLIRLLLSAENQPFTLDKLIDEIKSYQANQLGRKAGETALIELLPLPSPSVNQWTYGEWSSLPYLNTRKSYRAYCLPKRIRFLQQRILDCQPRHVIFYGSGYATYWEAIADTKFQPIEVGNFQAYVGKKSGTRFVMTVHPAARGITYEYFEKIGELIRD